MAASTVFYGVTRGATDLTRKVIELDTALVNIRRVMDMPEYKFNEMLEQSIVNVEELSGKLGDYLNLVAEFGRMGYNDLDTLDMSNTAQMLTNISDLTADESVSSLVAAMTAFNIVAEDSVDIADKLNEVDNKYSITTKDLAQSMNKSASTARVFGASLEELLGYTTAIGSATRETGNVVGNGIKTILSRIMTLPRAADALNAIGISITDMQGQVKPVADVIDELGKKWHTLSAEEQQNTAIKVAGTNQLSRFNALMLNYQTAVDATTTAMNAQGSASREQEKYNQSLEARINRLSTAWYGLADSVGQSILYDGIVVFTKTLEGATKAGDSAVASIGALPILLGITGAAVALLSTRFSMWTGTMIANRATTLLTTTANGTLSASMLSLAASSTVAQRALMMTGVGAALVAVGVGVSLFTSAISKNIQEQEEFDLYLKKNVDALAGNKEATEGLIKEYYALSQAKKSGIWSSEKEEEYLDVQQRLGDSFPALVKSIDSTGQSHLKNKEAIEAEIKATEDLIEAQNKSIVENSSKEFEKLNEDLNGSWFESFSNYIYGSLESRIKQQKNILEAMRENGADNGAIAEEELKLKQLERQYQQTSEEIKGHIFDVANAVSDVDISSNLSDVLQEFIGGLDFSKLDSSELETFSKEIGSIQEDLQEAINSGDEAGFDSAIAKLNSLASETTGFDVAYNSLSATLQNGNIALKNGSEIISVLTEDSVEATDSVAELAEAFDEYIAKLKELKTVEEQLLGMSSAQIDETNDLVFLYDTLANKTNLTAQEELFLLEAKEKLLALYPNYFQATEEGITSSENQIYMLREEMKANEALMEVIQLAKDGKLNAEEMMTYNSAMGVKARLENAKQELLALAKIVQAYNEFAQRAAQQAESLNGSGQGLLSEEAEIRARKFRGHANAQADATMDLTGTINSLTSEMNGYTGSIISSTGASGRSTSAQKKANEATSNSVYYSDKYALALSKINLELEKQNAIQSEFPDYTKKHIDSLKEEIKLLEKKQKLLQNQSAELAKQIKAGKIEPTGVVTTSSANSSSATASGTSGSSSGSYGGKYAKEVNKAAAKYGIDPLLIAAIIKTESGFNPNARSSAGAKGLMQLMDGTARDLGVKNSYNPEQNIMGGTRYIAQQIKAFGSLEKALAAYNAGPGNVRKYGGIPPFKETQNYIKKVMAEYNKGFSNAVTTATQQLSGWTGRRTSEMGDSRAGGSRRHNGVDIAMARGTRLDANVGGKVIASGSATSQGYDASYGNLVVVQDQSGAKHFYAHLDKAIAKLGSTIKAGQQLGTVGSTGASTGSHLHYGVQRNGEWIEPSGYINDAQRGIASNGSGSNDSAAETEQAVDEARQDLDSLYGEISEVEAQIQELRMQIVQATVAGYDRKIDKLKGETARIDWVRNERVRKAGTDENSAIWRGGERELLKNKQKQVDLLQEQHYYLDRQIRGNDNLTAAQREQLIIQKEQLNTRLMQEYAEKRAIEHNIRQSGVNQHIETANKEYEILEKQTEQLEYRAGFLDDEEKYSADLVKNLQEQLALQDKKKEQALANIRELEKEKKVVQDFPDLVKDIQEEIDKWKEQYQDIHTVSSELESSIKDIYSNIADTIIDEMKAVYEKQKEAALDAIDEEREAYQKMIDDKINAIDELADKESFEEDRADRQTSMQDIQSKINLLSLDDSQFAKAERAKLQKELDEMQKEYDDFIAEKEREDRKKALEDELTDKEKELDAEADATEQHWENIIEDERRWAEIREDILKGNVQTYIDEFANMSTWLNEHMTDIGESITENLIDKLKEATDLLNSINGVDSGTSHVGGETPVYKGENGKEDRQGKQTDKQDKVKIKQDTFYLKKEGNEYVPTDRILKKGQTFPAYGSRSNDGVYVVGKGFVTSDPKYTQYQYFKSGGYTGDNVPNEGALAVLHKKEIVLKESDTSNLLKTLEIMNAIHSKIRPIQPPSLEDRKGQGITIDSLVNIENFNGTVAEQDSLASALVNKLGKLGVKIK